jgi:hypothetical protein
LGPRKVARWGTRISALWILASLAGCALPQGAVILTNTPPNRVFDRSTIDPIPQEWNNRLLRVGNAAPMLGGDAQHTHSFAHSHKVKTGPSLDNDRPFGLVNVGVTGQHTHLIAAQSQSPTLTGAASSIPPARVLLAYIMSQSLFDVRPGVIVAYTGRDIPVGWNLCDGSNGTPRLNGLYIAIRRSGPVGGIIGQRMHSHNATHTHTWGVSAVDPHAGFGFYGDRFPAPHTDFQVSLQTHTHSAFEAHGIPTLTDEVAATPLSISVRFIQAGPKAREMPKGAVMPYIGDFTPLGWSSWGTSQGLDLSGKFLFGTNNADALLRSFGNAVHRHKIETRHVVEVEPPLAPGADVMRQLGPPMATAAHRHTAEIRDTITTGPAPNLPPYVSLRFIEKD